MKPVSAKQWFYGTSFAGKAAAEVHPINPGKVMLKNEFGNYLSCGCGPLFWFELRGEQYVGQCPSCGTVTTEPKARYQ